MKDVKTRIDKAIKEIRQLCSGLTIAFSGGQDSTLVALIAKDALGSENIKLLNITYGKYTYKKSIDIVKKSAEKLELELLIKPSTESSEEVWKNGPSCNRCTKIVKLNSVKNYAKHCLIASGANTSDSWGKTGIAIRDGIYSPLRYWNKKAIKEALEYYDFNIERIGENSVREGCKLKHLMKIMGNPSYHGEAVSESNEILIDELKNLEREIANVKIIGPLSSNIALINVKPMPELKTREKIKNKIRNLKSIDKVQWVDKPITLYISANPGLFGNEESKKWVHIGRIQNEFAFPVKIEWILSKNRRLETFQIVDYKLEDRDDKINCG